MKNETLPSGTIWVDPGQYLKENMAETKHHMSSLMWNLEEAQTQKIAVLTRVKEGGTG